MIDQQDLFRVLRQFARTMAGDYDTTQVLYELSDSVVDILGATSAGVALLDGPDLRFVTATNEVGAEAERAQERTQDGPCKTAIEENRPVAVADIAEQDERWPENASEILSIGVRGVLGIPLVLDDRRVGSLDVYSAEPHAWSDEAVEAGRALADIGAAYVLNARDYEHAQRTASQLQTALDTRVVIEQAKGVLSARAGITTDQAFQRIRTAARQQSVKIAVVSRRVIDDGYVPD